MSEHDTENRPLFGTIDKHFDECYELWRKSLCEERDFIEKNLDSVDKRRMYWWPFDGNGEILEIIRARAGDEEFLKSFRFLLDYPIKFYFPEIDKVLKILEELPKEYNKKVSELFRKLITKEPKYFDSYETWKKNCKKFKVIMNVNRNFRCAWIYIKYSNFYNYTIRAKKEFGIRFRMH